jgi:hypothetical protein
MRGPPTSPRGLVRIAAVCGALLIASGIAGCGGPIRSDELGRSVDTLTSSAAEGELLAEGVSADRTKTTFVRVRSREIGEVVDHEAEKLSDATAPTALVDEKAAAVGLADAIGSALGDLQVSPQDEAVSAQVQRRLGRLAARSEQFADAL